MLHKAISELFKLNFQQPLFFYYFIETKYLSKFVKKKSFVRIKSNAENMFIK